MKHLISCSGRELPKDHSRTCVRKMGKFTTSLELSNVWQAMGSHDWNGELKKRSPNIAFLPRYTILNMGSAKHKVLLRVIGGRHQVEMIHKYIQEACNLRTQFYVRQMANKSFNSSNNEHWGVWGYNIVQVGFIGPEIPSLDNGAKMTCTWKNPSTMFHNQPLSKGSWESYGESKLSTGSAVYLADC